MRVYEAIGETLKKLEVRATFGLMGDGNLRFMTHLAEELGMPYYAARHEGGAVAMADGYARVTGRSVFAASHRDRVSPTRSRL